MTFKKSMLSSLSFRYMAVELFITAALVVAMHTFGLGDKMVAPILIFLLVSVRMMRGCNMLVVESDRFVVSNCVMPVIKSEVKRSDVRKVVAMPSKRFSDAVDVRFIFNDGRSKGYTLGCVSLADMERIEEAAK